MPSNYREIIVFNNQVGGVKIRQRAVKVSDHLCVAYASPHSQIERYKIYSIISGRPVVNFTFKDFDQAIEVAEWLDKLYKDFWLMLSEYPMMNIPEVCKWSVPDGIRTAVALSSFEGRDTITLDDLRRAIENLKDKNQ